MYLPMPIMAYMVYGNTVQSTIDLNLSSKLIRDLIMILITGHVLFAFFIVISPVTQDLERVLRIPLGIPIFHIFSTYFVTTLKFNDEFYRIFLATGLHKNVHDGPGVIYWHVLAGFQRCHGIGRWNLFGRRSIHFPGTYLLIVEEKSTWYTYLIKLIWENYSILYVSFCIEFHRKARISKYRHAATEQNSIYAPKQHFEPQKQVSKNRKHKVT